MDIEAYEAGDLSGPSVRRGDKIDKAVVFLHGYGANGDDLISLAQPLGQGMQNCLFVSPNAPEALPAQSMNLSGRQWYDLSDLSPEGKGQGAAKARPFVDGFLDGLLEKEGLKPSQLFVLGFSQGCMMALETCYRRADPVAGVLGFSGALPRPEAFAAEVKAKPPALLVHGVADPVVPFTMLGVAASNLAAAGVNVQTHAVPELPHGIDPHGLESAFLFLNRHRST